jgi:hypothetical protein
VPAGPRLPAGPHDPLTQQELADPVPGPHQVRTDVFSGPDQVPRRLLRLGGHHHLDDFVELEQPGQMGCVAGVGLDPITRWALQLRRRRDQTRHVVAAEVAGQAEAGRTGLVDHLHRARQARDPTEDVAGIGCQSSLPDLAGGRVQPVRDDRPGMHIQPDERTILTH